MLLSRTPSLITRRFGSQTRTQIPLIAAQWPHYPRLSSTMAGQPQRRVEQMALFVCDIQEKFRPAIHEFDKVILTAKKAIKAANVLQLPIYATTQNAARLGPTVTDLEPLLKDNPLVKVSSDKTLFSMWTPELQAVFKKHSQGAKPAVVIVGIESHICVTQTTLDLLANGHKVYILADGVSSCNREEVPIALARLRAEGAVVTTSESWMYETMGDAGIPEFRNIVGLVKETKDDTQAALKGLLSPKI